MDKKQFLEYLFPLNVTCNCCNREIFNDKYFCDDCEKSLPYNDGIICDHCGRKAYNGNDYCSSCNGRLTYFDKARSLFNYKPPVRNMILAFKHSGKQYFAKIFASMLANLYLKSYFNSDLIVFTPMTSERLNMRGYNQAQLLANELSKLINLPVYSDVVVKTKETDRQAVLNFTQRHENLIGSFAIKNSDKIKGKSVLLVDDVMTTGATVEIISKKLINAKALKVNVLTIASVTREN